MDGETTKSSNCEKVKTKKQGACPPCKKLRSSMKARIRRINQREIPSIYLLQKIKLLEQEVEQLKKAKEVEQLKKEKEGEHSVDPGVQEKASKLKEKISQVALKRPEYFDSFNCLLFSEGLDFVLAEPRGHRFSETVKDWSQYLLWNLGERGYRLVLGEGFHGQGQHGKLDLDVNKFNFFLPAVSTLQKDRVPCIYYPKTQKTLTWQTAVAALKEKKAFLVFDETDLVEGVVYIPEQHALVGFLDGLVAEKDVTEESRKEIEKKELATKVLQFYLVEENGEVTVPLTHYPTKGISGKELHSIATEIIDELNRDKIEVIGSCSDGAKAVEDFLKLMKKQWKHLYDYEHNLKLFRNRIMNCRLYLKGSHQGFALADLYKRWSIDKQLQKLITKEDIFPKDKMMMKHVKNLMNEPLISYLCGLTDEKLAQLGNYLKHMQIYYKAFRDENLSIAERISLVEQVFKYVWNSFKRGVHGPTRELKFQILVNLKTLKKLPSNMKRVSHISSNCAELGFSIARAKYPRMWYYQYAAMQNMMCFSFIVEHVPQSERKFSIPPRNENRVYNDNGNVVCPLFLLRMAHGKLKKKEFYENAKKNSAEKNRDLCKDLTAGIRKGVYITIREKTAKNAASNKWVCGWDDCPRPYKTMAGLGAHILTVHSQDRNQVEKYLSQLFGVEFKFGKKSTAKKRASPCDSNQTRLTQWFKPESLRNQKQEEATREEAREEATREEATREEAAREEATTEAVREETIEEEIEEEIFVDQIELDSALKNLEKDESEEEELDGDFRSDDENNEIESLDIHLFGEVKM